MGRLFVFPNPVNEVSARLVAGGVVLMSLATIGLDQPLLLVPIAYGFLARVLAGPRFSPLGLLVTKVLTPRLPFRERLVPGPPKRFAQGMGALMSVTAAILALGLGNHGAAYVVLAALTAAAALEAVFSVCLGCQIFSLLMRAGVIPESICAECNDIGRRRTSFGAGT